MQRVLLTIFVVLVVASVAATQEPTYGNCNFLPEMTVTNICQQLHPSPEKGGTAVGVVGTAACRGEECFQKRDGYEITILAVGKPGEFPKTWHAWVTPKGGKLVNTYEGDKCILPDKDKKVGTGVQKIGQATALSETKPVRCKAERVLGEHLYHEHFASNEATKCLAWIECREDLVKD